MLDIAEQNKGRMMLPNVFLLKGLPEERFRLTSMPDLERDPTERNTVIENPEDDEYHRQELEKIETELNNQQRSAVLVEHYKKILEKGELIDFTEEFYHLLENESDEDIAIQVAYELIQFVDQDPGYRVDVMPEILKRYQNKSIIAWKINLTDRK